MASDDDSHDDPSYSPHAAFPRYGEGIPFPRGKRTGSWRLRRPPRLPRLALFHGAAPTESVAPPVEAEETSFAETTFIEIALLDSEDEPVAGEEYRIELPDGSVRTGSLDAAGRAYLDGLDPGNCRVSFPRLHGGDWQPA